MSDLVSESLSVLSKLRTESRNPQSMGIDTMSTKEMLTLLNNQDKTVPFAVESVLDDIIRAVDGIAERMAKGGRLLYFGAGTSGRLGVLDASECPPTYSTHPDQVVGVMAGGDEAIRSAKENVEDSVETGRADCAALNIRDVDTVVGIAASGRTPYVIGALDYAREQGALTIGLSTNSYSMLKEHSDILLSPDVGPEVVTGSTRMKSGTAQKLVLNMLSTGAMIKLGKTYSNLMVDFRPTNEKLRMRAPKIVREITNVSQEEALDVLSKCDGEVKVAIMSILAKVDPEKARNLLASNGGVLARAIGAARAANSTDTEHPVPVLMVTDGGGTNTRVLLLKLDGEVIGEGIVGSTNNSTVSIDVIVSRIEEAVAKAKGERRDLAIKKCWLGLAGMGEQTKRRELAEKLKHLAPEVTITSDVELFSSSLPKSTADSLSVSVIAGTGSSVLGALANGGIDVCGGWGPVLGDQGSGNALGTACIKAVSMDLEKAGPSTKMTDAVCAKWNAKKRLEFVNFIRSMTPEAQRIEISSLSKIVLECAYEQHDEIALKIVETEARCLANFIIALLKRNNAKSTDLALAGSVIVRSQQYRDTVLGHVRDAGFVINSCLLVDRPVTIAAKYLVASYNK
ncbi:N-acetylmuramic acid 6-phosphate etherase [Zancudomyces culisetae]|uniref:N-acetyl-D-glucosamine kinase n=1 Tax=Zancudomyces culisetae TaxID=1213189 RepID=A0A1R1PSG3_ZANCU|nr:N-acetylmuramic acid 6-phosphate etherase [Zancudomyces culisetae]|eukprot:OMH83833.1 N-acetylmuramic acid 6-phosphate etherase [Zancudomyces culisetae]